MTETAGKMAMANLRVRILVRCKCGWEMEQSSPFLARETINEITVAPCPNCTGIGRARQAEEIKGKCGSVRNDRST